MKRKVTCFTSMALAVLMAVSPVAGSSVSAFAAEPSDDTTAIQVTPSKEDSSDEIVVEADSDAIEVEKEMQTSVKIGDTGESDIVVDTEYHTGDAVPVHVTAENPTDKAEDFRLYFWDYGETLPEDKAEWSKVLTDACEDVKVAELQDTDEYAVDLKQGEDTVQSKVSFVSDKDDKDQLTAAYLSMEIPSGASLDTVFHISSDVAETVTVVPVFDMESENPFYGDAAVAQWKENPIVVEADQSEDTAETEPETEDADAIVVETEEPADSFLSIYVGDSSAETETEEPVVEEEAETEESDTEAEPGTDTESEVSVEAETEEDAAVMVTPDTADLNASDFASMRLVVLADDASVITNDSDMIGQYDNVYLLQFTSIQQAMNAYTYYKDKVTAVEPDATVETAAETESVRTADIAMTEDENPVAMLNEVEASEKVQDAHGVIALIDTGVSESENVIDRVSVIDDVLEGNGHGDEMVKAIVSQDAEAEILSIRAMDDNGFGTISSLVAAMEYAIEQKVDIINLSLYAKSTLMTSVLKEEILKATDAGILVVGSAGNDGQDAAGYIPGAVEEAYIIGAAKEDGFRLETSNFGETVDYNVVAGSTSEAAALFTGYVSANGLDAVEGVVNQELIFTTDIISESSEKDDVEKENTDALDEILFAEPSSAFSVANNQNQGEAVQSDFESTNNDVIRADDDDVIIDAVNEAYVKGHLDSKYVSLDKFELANMLQVKQTLMDASKVTSDDTIDSVMGQDNSGEKFIGMIDTAVALYDVSDTSDYLVGFANTLQKESQYQVQDFLFAITNNDGDVITDAVYDDTTGLAYIPKKYFESSDGTVLYNVQIQLMQVVDTTVDNMKSSYALLCENNNSYVNAAVGDSIFRMESDVDLSKNAETSDMLVTVNGLPVSEDLYSYDKDTNSLELNVSSGAISSLSVSSVDGKIQNDIPVTYSATPDQMPTVGAPVEFSDGVGTGYYTVCDGYYAYGSSPDNTGSYGYYNLQSVVNLITNGGSIDFGALERQLTQMNIVLSLGQSNIPGMKFGNDFIRLQCAHVSNPLGTASNQPVGGNYGWVKIAVRVLWMGIGADGNQYAIIGFLTQTTHSQAGAGFLKFMVKPQKGGLSIQKQTGDAGITDGNPNYSLAGAVYGVYKDAGCTQEVTSITTNASGYAATADNALDAGTYYVKEKKSSPGYDLDPNVYTYTIAGGSTAGQNKQTSSEPPKTGDATLLKVSSLPNVSEDNNCYTLEGAEYGIWKDASCSGTPWKTMITDKDGNAYVDRLPFGTYYVKETKASKGFELDPQVYTITVTEANPSASFTSTEVPGNDPMGISIEKTWTGEKTDTVPSLEGAQFTVEYYDNMDKNVSGTPKRTWVIEIKKVKDIYVAALDDEYLVEGSDPLYKSEKGNTILPYGTYKIWESKAAPDYDIEGTLMNVEGTMSMDITKPFITVVDKDTTGNINLRGGNAYKGFDETVPLSITIKKFDESDKPLEGVTFKIQSKSGYAETQSGWKGEVTTGKDGIAKWTNLYPDVYTITEVKTPDGKNLLRDPIVVELPGKMTQADAKKYNLKDPDPNDKYDGVVWDEYAQVYYINDPVFEVGNDVTFKMPMSGGLTTPMTFVPLIAGMGILGGLGVVGFRKKRKK